MDDLNACAQCGYQTQNLTEFIMHVEEHELEQQQEQEQEQQIHQQNQPTDVPSGSPIKLFPNRINRTSGKIPRKPVYSCPHCNFSTYMSQHMKSHLEAHYRHEGQMYQCDLCQMQFSQKANMHRHRMRHSGVKPYSCRYCQKRFFRKDQMQEHSMTHIKTGADFDCPVSGCSLQFGQHSVLRGHLDDFHSVTPDKPAHCKRCSLLFTNARRLLLHFQTKHDDPDDTAPQKNCIRRKETLINSPSMVHVKPQSYSSEQPLPVIAHEPQFSDDDNNPSSPQLDTLSESPLKIEQNDDDTAGFWPDVSATVSGGSAVVEEMASNSSSTSGVIDSKSRRSECIDCGLVFLDQTLYFLHKGLHSESDPWKCGLCGQQCRDKYRFHTHVISADHS